MRPLSTAAAPPPHEPNHVLAGAVAELVRQWIAPGAVVVSLVAFIVYQSAALSALQERVARVESDRIADQKLLKEIDRKLALLVCKSDPTRCDIQ